MAAVTREWAKVGPEMDWSHVGPRITALVAASQIGASREALAYVDSALAEQGIRVAPEFAPALATGAWSLDGLVIGSLDSMLYGAVARAREAKVASWPERVSVGLRYLQTAVPSQVADAGRHTAGLAISARPGLVWMRAVNPPCCKRCAVLAGKTFRRNADFDRHPQCDCTAIPSIEDRADDVRTHVGVDQIKDLSKAERQAILDGADMNQVINAKRSGNRWWTGEGTTTTSYASYVRREVAKLRGKTLKTTGTQAGPRGAAKAYTVRRLGPRPTPAAIYRYAGSHEEAIRLLHAEGYIVGDIAAIARRGV